MSDRYGDAVASEARSLTFQDMERARGNLAGFVLSAVRRHIGTEAYRVARRADLYDHQLNPTINELRRLMWAANGAKVDDPQASNSRLASNFFHRLNTQRCQYSLGNGVTFAVDNEGTKKALGRNFDRDLQGIAYDALIHGVCFGFWNLDRLYRFPLTEFVPLWDEETGALRAGARFWRIAPNRPLQVVLYEEDGFTRYVADRNQLERDARLTVVREKQPYITRTAYVPADGVTEVIAADNYGSLPIVPMWGSKLRQSTLVGMERSIDSYDLVRSGFANDMADCAEVYWIVENRGGMDQKDLARFLDRLKFHHIAEANTDDGGRVAPYTNEVPYQARQAFLDSIRKGIYEDFGGLDVHAVEAGATNDHIEAAYQPLDENASDFEYQVSDFIGQVLRLAGIDDVPTFQRNRISNQGETVQMVVQEAQWLDHETILRKLPNIGPDEVAGIMQRVEDEANGNYSLTGE